MPRDLIYRERMDMQYAAFQNKLMTEYISKAAIHSQGLQLLARPSSVACSLPPLTTEDFAPSPLIFSLYTLLLVLPKR